MRLICSCTKVFFRLFAKFAKKKGNVILFASGSRAEIGGNEKFIYDRMIERGLDKSTNSALISRKA